MSYICHFGKSNQWENPLLRLFFLLTVSAVLLFAINWLGREVVRDTVVLEAGETLALDLFLIEPTEDAAFATDVSSVDTSVLNTYDLEIAVRKKTYHVQLIVQDTIAPTAEAAEVTTLQGRLPDAADCVTDIQDATPVAVSYQQEPDIYTGGESMALVLLADAAGNSTTIEVPVQVLCDTEPPVIEGVRNLRAYIGDSISYKENITVTDNMDASPTLEIDNSQVHLNQAGTYEVIYKATDASGNTAVETITLTLEEKVESTVEPETVYEMADKVLAKITDSSMDDMQVAYAIYRWTKYNIAYTGHSDKSSWVKGAYDAFKNRAGDCFNYYAAARALLDEAGIQNIGVVKSDTSHSSHYWNLINLGNGWYHFDCTPRSGSGDNFFMVTDEELNAYSRAHNNSHIFDSSLYPERATESVQSMVDYSAAQLKR